MSMEKLGGASRPRRRRALLPASVIFVGGILLFLIRDSAALVTADFTHEPRATLDQPDLVYARELLQAVAGANGILCTSVDRLFDTGYATYGLAGIVDADFADARSNEIAQWTGIRRFDVSVLPVARNGMHSNDACVRRIAARIAGRARAERLHEALQSELNATQPATRAAAVFALGFAEDAAALPQLNARLQDSSQQVRVAAVWAMGRIGNEASNNTLVRLLENDKDAIMRSAAAWALGRIND